MTSPFDPLDTDRIAGRGASVRSLTKERAVAGPSMEVWAAWTSKAQVDAWWGPADSNIELRVGGPFEILFNPAEPRGRQGSEDCKYLSYVPGEMISFTWNAPPHLPLRSEHTWVVITFRPMDASTTMVRLVHTGFLVGEDWDDYLAYFDNAWDHVLRRLEAHWA